MTSPEIVVDSLCDCGENPLWHPDEGRLYWTDIPAGKIYCYDPSTGEHETFYDGEVVGGFTLQQDGSLLLFMEKGSVAVLRSGELIPVVEEIAAERGSRFNDVIADPEGRVFCGTMPSPDHPGSLYRLDCDGKLTSVLGGIGGSNGMGFTRDRSRMYYTDSAAREIYVYDYDRATGGLQNRGLFCGLPEGEGTPDGMTVDSDGYVWSAIWDGGRLVCYTSEGDEVLRIPFPARKVSSLTFGGDGCDEIYVTTAGGGKRKVEGPGAGAVFRLRLGIAGVPEFRSRIGI